MLQSPVKEDTSALRGRPLLDVRGLKKHFVKEPFFRWQPTTVVRAVDGIDFKLEKGKTLGLVGESGCGKTTTGRMLLRLDEPTSGAILLDGTDIAWLKGDELKRYRRPARPAAPRCCRGSKAWGPGTCRGPGRSSARGAGMS